MQGHDGIFKLMDVIRTFYERDVDDHILVVLLIGVVIFDIILGVSRAWATHSISSTKWRKGLTSHMAVLIAVIVMYPFFSWMGFSALVDTYIVAMCAAYGSSILTNLSILGVKIPGLDNIVRERIDADKFKIADEFEEQKKQ